MNAPLPLTQFMSAVDRMQRRNRRDHLSPFRDFVDALDRDREARKQGKRDPYFDRPAFSFLNQNIAAGASFPSPQEDEE